MRDLASFRPGCAHHGICLQAQSGVQGQPGVLRVLASAVAQAQSSLYAPVFDTGISAEAIPVAYCRVVCSSDFAWPSCDCHLFLRPCMQHVWRHHAHLWRGLFALQIQLELWGTKIGMGKRHTHFTAQSLEGILPSLTLHKPRPACCAMDGRHLEFTGNLHSLERPWWKRGAVVDVLDSRRSRKRTLCCSVVESGCNIPACELTASYTRWAVLSNTNGGSSSRRGEQQRPSPRD